MPKPRQTIIRDTVFRRLGEAPTRPVQGIAPAQPPTRQTAVWLADEEIAWLDSHIHDIKRAGWRTLTRSAFIRAVLRSAMEQEPDLTGVHGEADLIERLGAKRK
jgi:hypothetical protein